MIQVNTIGCTVVGNNNSFITFAPASNGREYTYSMLGQNDLFEGQSTSTSVSNINKIFIANQQVAYLSDYGIKNDDIATYAIKRTDNGSVEIRIQKKVNLAWH